MRNRDAPGCKPLAATECVLTRLSVEMFRAQAVVRVAHDALTHLDDGALALSPVNLMTGCRVNIGQAFQKGIATRQAGWASWRGWLKILHAH